METIFWISLTLNAMTFAYIVKHEQYKENQQNELVKLFEERMHQTDAYVNKQVELAIKVMKKHEFRLNQLDGGKDVRNVGDTDSFYS